MPRHVHQQTFRVFNDSSLARTVTQANGRSYTHTCPLPAFEAVQDSVAPVVVTAVAATDPGADGAVHEADPGGFPQISVLPEYSVMSLTVTGVALEAVGMPWKDQSSAGLCADGNVMRNCTWAWKSSLV